MDLSVVHSFAVCFDMAGKNLPVHNKTEKEICMEYLERRNDL